MAQNEAAKAFDRDETPRAMIYDGWGFVPLPEADTTAEEAIEEEAAA